MKPQEFEQTIRRIVLLKESIKEQEAQVAELFDSLGELEYQDYLAGDYILKVQPNVRFDAATARKVLTPEEFESILLPKPDSTLAKKVLGEERFKDTQKLLGARRTIVPVEDDLND